MKIFKTILLMLAIGLTSVQVIAQCNASEIVDICTPKLANGFMFIKGFEVNGKDGQLEKVEYSYPFANGTDYIINLCPQDVESEGLVVTLSDHKRNKLVTNVIDGQYASAIIFSCKASGLYYITYTFEKSNSNCGGSIIGFKVKQ